MKRGKRPKPSAAHILQGTFRKDRHGDRADTLPTIGMPEMPKGFNAIEAALWKQVVPDLMARKVVSEKDTAELVSLCELWNLYRKSVELAKDTPTDKEVRCAVTGYWAAFDRVAAKFGLTATDGANIKAPKAESARTVAARQRA